MLCSLEIDTLAEINFQDFELTVIIINLHINSDTYI
jgi:hypothetical protein